MAIIAKEKTQKILWTIAINEGVNEAAGRLENLARITKVHFAKLLVSSEFRMENEKDYYYWEKLYLFCYGRTVEEMAGSDENSWTVPEDDEIVSSPIQ